MGSMVRRVRLSRLEPRHTGRNRWRRIRIPPRSVSGQLRSTPDRLLSAIKRRLLQILLPLLVRIHSRRVMILWLWVQELKRLQIARWH